MKCHPDILLYSPHLHLSSLSGSRDGQESAGIPDSFSGVNTASVKNIFGREVESGKHILK